MTENIALLQPSRNARNDAERLNEASEDAIAREFTRIYGETLRFDHDVGCWYIWEDTRWAQNGTNRAFHYARTLGREIGEGKQRLCKASVAGGAERFARADPIHAVRSDIWDADPMLLGTPEGTVDLRTGRLRNPDPRDFITKQTSVAPEEGDPALWLRFLAEALDNDKEVIRFVRQWLGYCLTGDTREQAMLFAYGPGGNGKGVFFNTVVSIMQDYAVTAAMETFTASRSNRHSTELAMLRGARLVTASETDQGGAWAEARIKQMTGGDRITARFMRQDNFTFEPQFKLTIAGNHAPTLRSVDDAIRRRFKILPFLATPASPDRRLEQKLRAEHGQILQWMIGGCLEWQREGLHQPAVITEATEAYFEDQDLFRQWIEECCIVGPEEWDTMTAIMGSWSDYARKAGEDPGTQKELSAELQRHKFKRRKSNSVRKYLGLSIRRPREE